MSGHSPVVETIHAEGTFTGAGGMRLYYQSWRPATASVRATVALVHGFGGHSGLFTRLVDALAGNGVAAYGFDHRGMGRSPGPRGHILSWNEFLQDVRAFLGLIGEREPAAPLFLSGESMGGLVALEHAEQHPEGLRGVIALSPLLSQPGIPAYLLMLGRVLSRVWPGFSMESRLEFDAASRDADAVRLLKDDPLIHSRGSARLSTELMAAITRTQAHARDLVLPLLIMHGGADTIVPPGGSRAFFEHVTSGDKDLREYDGAYHMLTHDQCADEVVGDVQDWIERHL